MNKYYFSFGYDHRNLLGESLFGKYVVIEAENETEAREKMWQIRGDHWSACYEGKHAQEVIECWGWEEISEAFL